MTTDISDALAISLKKSAQAGFSFENAEIYNNELSYTFQRTLADLQAIAGPKRILEIGSFTAVVSLALRSLGHEVTASDMPFVINDLGMKKLLDDHSISSLAANLSNHPFPAHDNSFDIIIFNEVLEHLNFNPIPLIREFHRILKHDGLLYCATPNLNSAKNRWLMLRGKSYINPVQHLIWNLEPETGMSVGLHWREWSKSELLELFSFCGFTIEKHCFGLTIANQSNFLRRLAVKLMYRMHPSLMPNQVVFARKR